jgi:Serine hydrolase (FSH1).
MIKRLIKIIICILGGFVLIFGFLFFFQEKLIFHPEKLDKNYQFKYEQDFEEINIKAQDGKALNGLLFKSENPQGLIFYLHGNSGSLSSWGNIAKTYTDLNYDIFIVDYRSYGKSEGKIQSQEQLFQDNQIVYDELKQRYNEDEIIVMGFSIGTGMASKLASTNNPKLLILKAPYYNLTDMIQHTYMIIPTFMLKYKFETNKYLKLCRMPVIIFHGDQDEIIYHGSSLKLKDEFKTQDTLIILNGQRHNGITRNEDYKIELKKILTK